jgi:hypothetical protein
MTREDERLRKALERIAYPRDTPWDAERFFVLLRPLTTSGVPIPKRIIRFENCVGLRTRDIVERSVVLAIALQVMICDPVRFPRAKDSRRFHSRRREYNVARVIDHALWLSSSEDAQFDLYVAAALESLQRVPAKYLSAQDSKRIGQIIAQCTEDSQNAELFGRPEIVVRP